MQSIPLSRRLLVALVLAFVLAYSILSGLLAAQWSVYADHEIAVYLGEDRRTTWQEILPLTLQTEVGYPGKTTRYRPSFYFLWVLESFLWGDCVRCWYGARIASLTIYLAAVIFWLRGSTSWFGAFGLTTILVGMSGFPFVWIGIGNGEQYFNGIAALYLLLLACALQRIDTPNTALNRACWLGILASGLLVIGLKENMVVLTALPVALLAFRWWRYRRVDLLSLFVTSILCLYTLFIVWAVSKGVLANRADFYGTTISPSDRFARIAKCLTEFPMVLPTTILVVWTAIATFSRGIATRSQLRSSWMKLALLFFCLVLHLGFYGRWVTDSRYSSPGELLLFAFMAICIRDIPQVFGWRVRWDHAVGSALFCLGSCFFLYSVTLPKIQAYITPFVERSLNYTSTLLSIRDAAESNPSLPIIFKSASPADFEAIFAVNRFLKYLGVSNPLVLQNLPIVEPHLNSDFFAQLRQVLEQLAESGADIPLGTPGTLPSHYGAIFTPLSSIDSTTRCLGVLFQRVQGDTQCEKVFRVTY